ncbi:MAG: BPSS1780 family membrane protein [Betaproteobacteria bacterium]
MQARIVPAAAGARWLAEGWRLFRVAPLGWLALVFAYWLLMTLASLLPFIGTAAAAVLVPPFAVGFMAAARAASRGGAVELALLFEGFRHSLAAQLALGVVYFACLSLVLGASALVDDGALARWMATGARPEEAVLRSDAFLAAFGTAAALYVPVMLMFWFAPPLAAWHSSGAAKALFFSFFACLLNWRAFLAYGAVTAAVALILPFAALSLLMLASGGTPRVQIMALVFPLLIVLMPTLFASFYASYRDVFGMEAKSP